MTAPNFSFRQVLVDFFDDPNYHWHGRVLLLPSPNGDGRWIGCSPDLELEVLNLAEHRVLPVSRGQPYPQRAVGGGIYGFDDLDDADFDQVQRDARELAVVLGFSKAPAGDAGGRWRIANTASESFGELVPNEALDDADTYMDDTKGIVRIDGAAEFMEKVADADIDSWREAKTSGKTIDARVLTVRSDAGGRRHLAEDAAVALWTEKVPEHFRLSGPAVAGEFMRGLAIAGQSLVQHHLDFVAKAGLSEKGAVAREHTALTEAARAFISHDQVNGTQLRGLELLFRRLVCMETAVSRNPKNPDWDGLDFVLSTTLTESGTVVTPVFADWISKQQLNSVTILKQGRLLREEQAAASKQGKGRGKKGAEEVVA